MGTFQDTVVDILRGIAASLQFFLPATFLVGVLTWWLVPRAFTGGALEFVALILAIIAVLYIFQSFSPVMHEVLQGRYMRNSLIMAVLTTREQVKFFRHHERIKAYEDKVVEIEIEKNRLQKHTKEKPEYIKCFEDWQKRWGELIEEEQEALRTRYPPIPELILPTRYGNIFTAYEIYSERTYGMDRKLFWPLFAPVLAEKQYTSFIDSRQATLDFFVNLVFACGILWPFALGVFALTGRTDAGTAVLLLPILAYILYRAACRAVIDWSDTANTAFDLYRFDLKDAIRLGLPPLATFEEEKAMWQNIANLLRSGGLEPVGDFDYTFLYSKRSRAE